jgi:ankyrin repeat protein
MQVAVYRNDCDLFLHLAIKHGPTEAAMALIENGANIDCPNAKRLVRYLRLRNLLQHFVVCQLYHVCIAIALFRE